MNIAKITSKITKRGISLELKNKRKNLTTELTYPKTIWQSYDKKDKLIRNLAYLLTLPFPLVSGFKEIYYNTPEPEFKKKFQKLMLKDLPTSTFESKQNLEKLKKQFLSLKLSFSKKYPKKTKPAISKSNRSNSDTILPLSMGKDSLLSLAISTEINLKPIPVYINDTVSPTENKLKIKTLKRIKLKKYVVTNSIEKLNDFETWNRKEMVLNYAHMMTGFCFILLPFIHFFNSKYLILGNERNMDFHLKLKNNKLYPSYDQTTGWTKEQDKMIKEFEKATIFSIIRPLTNLAIIKILHSRYPEISKYQNSCHGLDASKSKRWCLDCSSCAETSLFLTAFGINPKILSLEKIFSKKYRKLYDLFKNKKISEVYDIIFSREQELLTLLLSMRQGSRGYIIDYFKKHYLKEALAREDELRKKYFKVWPSNIPRKIKKDVLSIYKEELRDLV